MSELGCAHATCGHDVGNEQRPPGTAVSQGHASG